MLWRILLSVAFALSLPATALASELEQAEAAYWRGDYEKALSLLRSLAEQGDPHAEYYFGFMFERGAGVPQNYEEAAKWYRRVAERGHPHAQNNLGVL
jgi:TPR repeat protein